MKLEACDTFRARDEDGKAEGEDCVEVVRDGMQLSLTWVPSASYYLLTYLFTCLPR